MEKREEDLAYSEKREMQESLLRCQFHQHFTCKFFEQKCLAQFSLVMFQLCNCWCQNIGTKCSCKMLMKSTPGTTKFLGTSTSLPSISLGWGQKGKLNLHKST